MHTTIKKISFMLMVSTCWLILGFASAKESLAGQRFSSSYPCSDTDKVCVSGPATRNIDGFDVYRDCWEWSYTKTCNYPSKNNCAEYSNCYFIANTRCLLFDSQGTCVNQEREFSCKSWDPGTLASKTVRQDLIEKEGQEGLICKGIPCMDGNCVDKSFETNGEMMDSISKLYAFSKMKPARDGSFNLFQGSGLHCSKKMAEYTNCCRVNTKGWGKEFGARCSKDEQLLADNRAKKLCVYVGKEKIKTAGVTTVVKHHFCCFGNMLDKVVQLQGRCQLGLNFGSGGTPNCRGLTLEEIQRIDWEQVDFTEFIEDFKVKFFGNYQAPSAAEIEGRVNSSIPNIRKHDGNKQTPPDNMTGWRSSMPDEIEE